MMQNRIGGVDEAHRNYMFTAFLQFRYGHVVGRTTVTIHKLDISEDGNARVLLVTPPDMNDALRLEGLYLS